MRRRQTTGTRGRRAGLSLIDVVVAVSVVGLLAALTLPAVQASRERARRMGCRNNVRQLGLAVHGHEATHGRIPGSPDSGWSVQARLLPWLGAGPLADELDYSMHPGAPEYDWSRVDVGYEIRNATGLPAPAVFRCPSDGEYGGLSNAVGYAACVSATRETWTEAALFRPFVLKPFNGSDYRGHATQFTDVTDGLSTTAAFGEILPVGGGPHRQTGNTRYRYVGGDEATEYMIQDCNSLPADPKLHFPHRGLEWALVNGGSSTYTHAAPPNTRPCFNKTSTALGLWPSDSPHRGLVFVGWGDGAVSAVSDQVDLALWRAAATARGGETIDDDAF